MGTNHLGNFALTCLWRQDHDRVISGNAMYHVARIHFDRPQLAHPQVLEDVRVLGIQAGEPAVRSRAREPCIRRTRRIRDDRPPASREGIAAGIPMAERSPVWRCCTTPAQGALATLQALTTNCPAGRTSRPVQSVGQPRVTGLPQEGRDPVAARRLWEFVRELTGCDWPR